MYLDGAAICLINDAVRYGNILGLPASKAKHGPSRTEGRVCDRHILATSEKSASVILRLHRAITHRHVLAADEMEAVIVPVHAVVNAQTVGFHKRALNHADGMVGAVVEENVAQI